MSGFLGAKLEKNVIEKFRIAVCVTGMSMVFVSLLVAGCKKRAVPESVAAGAPAPDLRSVVTNRMLDPAYRKALDQNRQEQGKKASERNRIVEKMTGLIAKTRTLLPAGADDATVKAELAKNPEWQALEAQNARMIGEIEKTLAEARETVRKRMETEVRDVKAVAEGQAVAADPQPAQ